MLLGGIRSSSSRLAWDPSMNTARTPPHDEKLGAGGPVITAQPPWLVLLVTSWIPSSVEVPREDFVANIRSPPEVTCVNMPGSMTSASETRKNGRFDMSSAVRYLPPPCP